jgi:hypothetical protein
MRKKIYYGMIIFALLLLTGMLLKIYDVHTIAKEKGYDTGKAIRNFIHLPTRNKQH